VPPDGLAGSGFLDWKLQEVDLDAHLLRAGSNVIAVRWVNSSLNDSRSRFSLELECLPPSRGFVERQVGPVLEGLAARSDSQSQALSSYLQGRLLEAEEDLLGATRHFQDAVALDPETSVTRICLARAWEHLGDPSRADAILLEKLGSLRGGDGLSLWDEWLRNSFLGVRRPAGEALSILREVVSEGKTAGGYVDDLEWLLERLAAGESIRINCGGKDCRIGGQSWSRDRFALGGHKYYHAELSPDRPGIVPPLDQLERCFPGLDVRRPAYRVPLPLGKYEVVLRFLEAYSDVNGARRFDVLLEDKVLLEEFEPLAEGGFEVPVVRAHRLEVSDGHLDIAFRSISGEPQMVAFEVRRVSFPER
jgi:hypothetical protein